MYGIREYLEACQHRKSFLESQLAWLESERTNYRMEAEKLSGVAERIRQELIGYLLPEVGDQHIARVESKLSYPGLSPIKRDYDNQFAAAEKRRVELESLDEIQQYDYLINQAEKSVGEIRPAYENSLAKIREWQSAKWFARLEKRGYFELEYKPGFFRRFFDWRDVSFLMSHLTKEAGLDFENPQLVREHYRLLRDQVADITAAFETRDHERQRIENLKAEHQSTLEAPERLLGELFRELGDAAIGHLNACPADLRVEIARGDSNLNAFFRKQIGTDKQIQYLKELSVTRIDSRIQQISQELAKINAKIRKLEMQRRRGKRKRYSQNDLQRMKTVKTEKWEKNRLKTIKMREKISNFDKHDRGSCAADYLWWDLMTGGARADDIYEVREFRQQHPSWNHKTYDDPATHADETDERYHEPAFDDAAEDLANSMTIEDQDDYFTDPS